jgi:hypothetical protein
MFAFRYYTYMLLYLKDSIDERWKTPACDAQMDKKNLVTRTILVSQVAQSIPKYLA